jgi:hypothetical protein
MRRASSTASATASAQHAKSVSSCKEGGDDARLDVSFDRLHESDEEQVDDMLESSWWSMSKLTTW